MLSNDLKKIISKFKNGIYLETGFRDGVSAKQAIELGFNRWKDKHLVDRSNAIIYHELNKDECNYDCEVCKLKEPEPSNECFAAFG